MSRRKGPKGPYKPPLTLDMDPDEALTRLAQTDPREVKEEQDADALVLREDLTTGDRFLPYVGKDGIEVELRVEGKTFWATQGQMSQMFGIQVPAVSRHLKKIFNEGELEEAAVVSLKEITASDGKVYKTKVYNLNALISVGYRVESKQGTMFRIWATERLVQYLVKGFVIDAPRLKEPDAADRVAELREIIRDIRASEANVYAELRRICALCSDYDPASEAARQFYAHLQAKLYWAVVSHTPAMVLKDRANSQQPNMGLRAWPKTNIRQEDAIVAKNYLAGAELEELNRLTTILLDIFDDQLKIGKLTLMAEAGALLDKQLANLNRSVLSSGGKVKSEDAIEHAKGEYRKFDAQRRALRVEEKQKELAALKAAEGLLPPPSPGKPKKG